jgi:hypothetical protein
MVPSNGSNADVAPFGEDDLDPTSNPYRALCLDPWSQPDRLTDVLREMAEEADPEQRRCLQGMWRRLTLNKRDQLDMALFAHPSPARNLPRDLAKLDSDELVQRFRFSAGELTQPAELETYQPALRELAVLPPVRLVDDPSLIEWTDLDPATDPLLRL